MKVAHITTIDMPLRYFLLNQLLSIQQAGYDVSGISSPGPEVPVIEAAGIRHIPAPMTRRFTPLADLVSLWRLIRILRRGDFTIVHAHFPKPALLGQLAARMAGVPIVIRTLHGFYFHDLMHPLLRRFYITLEKIAARCSDLILSVNQEDVDTAVREGICDFSKIQLLGPGGIGLDLSRFDPESVSSLTIAQKRAELGIPSHARVVGFVGRLVAEKGVLELLQAARLVRQGIPEVRFLIIGPVDHEKPGAITPVAANEHGVADISIFAGMRQDMPELYALMDVFVLPSHIEGLPRSSMEASAMGIPCVVTDVRGCREAVEHERNGLLVPLGDIQALADSIIAILSDPGLARRIGEEGRRIALERFDEEPVFERVESEYARLLIRKGIAVAHTSSLAP